MLKKSRKKTSKKKTPKAADNSKGQIFYGLHMYPGVAEYRPSRGESFRLLIKEPAIRKMGPTFPGRPIFVHHNEEFSDDLNTLRTEADGWVTDSFYNESDGKHWVKILLVTDEALEAQAQGYTLSNSYEFKRIDDRPGVYNGLDYDFEVLDGEYKHMALVPDPRYDSLLLTPADFKKYNDQQRAELKRVANSNDEKGKTMKKGKSKISLSLFKKTTVENSKAKELENLSILLPKSKQEKTISELVTIADGVLNSKGKARVCNAEDVVLVEGEDGTEEEITIGEMWEELEDLRARVAEIEGDLYEEDAADDDTVENEDDEEIENADDSEDEDDEVETPRKKAASKKPLKRKQAAKNSRDDIDDEDFEDDDEDETPTFKRRASNSTKTQTRQKPRTAKNQRDGAGDRSKARVKADRARNAADRHDREDFASNVVKISTPQTQLARGMEQYGEL